MLDDMPPISRNTAVMAARELQAFSSTRQLAIRTDWDKALADLNADADEARAFLEGPSVFDPERDA